MQYRTSCIHLRLGLLLLTLWVTLASRPLFAADDTSDGYFVKVQGNYVTTPYYPAQKNPVWSLPQTWGGGDKKVYHPGTLPNGLSGTDFTTSYPGNGPKYGGPSPVEDCKPQAVLVPKTYIGFHNNSSNKIGIVLLTQGAPQQNVVVLEAGEIVTINCGACNGAVTAVVPTGSAISDADYRMQVSPGGLYVPRYNASLKRWEVAQAAPVGR